MKYGIEKIKVVLRISEQGNDVKTQAEQIK